MSRQQFVILSRETSRDGGLAPLGSRQDIIDRLAQFNTAPEVAGQDILYGPGIRLEFSPGEPVSQILLTVTEEEIAWQVMMRLAKALEWKLLDPSSGRELSP